MVEFRQVHPLGDLDALAKAHKFNGVGDAPIRIEIPARTVCAQLFASKGNESKLEAKLKISGEPGKVTTSRNQTSLPLSPGQWMVVSKDADDNFASKLAKRVKGLGYVSQQSDSRICLKVSGPMARELMSRGCRLDLDARSMQAGKCAQTTMAQVGVLLHQSSDDPSYDLFVYSGFARSFFEWLAHSAAQFGFEVIET